MLVARAWQGFSAAIVLSGAVLCPVAVAGGVGDEWVMLLASGIRGVGGAVLRFRSKHLTHGEHKALSCGGGGGLYCDVCNG